MNIGIYGRLVKEDALPYVQQLINLLYDRNITFFIHEDYFPRLKNIQFRSQPELFGENNKNLITKIDYIFSVGGDGTLLDTITIVKDSNIPIVGINIGRLGFLASIGKDEIESAITALQLGTYSRDERTLIHLDSNVPGLFGGDNFALNEFTIHKKDSSAMITIHTYINGEFLMSYWADGLIISTPTGSTGYSL
ncbi:MAG: NAD(+)/NADH kinase, partial [Chitinophagales bacterium]